MASEEMFTVQFPAWYDELAETEMYNKGHLTGCVVQLADGRRYPVAFMDSVHAREEAHERFEQGYACLTEPGLVIVPEVTKEAIQRAVAHLVQSGFFDHLQPLS